MGEFFALSCALVWAAAVIFFRKSGESIPAFSLNLFRVSISSVLLLGSYVALMLWIPGMKYIPTGKAGILNQTSTLFILVLATIILKEPFSRGKGFSIVLTLGGILLTLHRQTA